MFKITNNKFDNTSYDEVATQKNIITNSIDKNITDKIFIMSNNSKLGIYMILLSGIRILSEKYCENISFNLGIPVVEEGNKDINRFISYKSEIDSQWTYKNLLGDIQKKICNKCDDSDESNVNTVVILEDFHKVSANVLDNKEYLFKFKIQEQGISVEFIYGNKLSKNEGEELLKEYCEILKEVVTDPNLKISNLILSVKEEDNYEGPANEIEWTIANIWSNILEMDNIGVNDNLFNLGVSSYKVVQIAMELSSNFVVDINDIFEFPTIREISKKVKYKKDNWKEYLQINKKLASLVEHSEDLKQNIEHEFEAYDNSILKYKNIDLEEKNNYKNILLTGATGFLGINLLNKLLSNRNYNLYLLVRGNEKISAEKRVEDLYNYYFESSLDEYKQRVFIINGDLTKNKFGLGDSQYQELSNIIDCIINCAANVMHYGTEKDFFSINKDGVQRLIDFCLEGNKKDLHQVSTGGVAALEQKTNYYLFTENQEELECKLKSNYLQSKYEGERLVIKSRDKGINGNVYRVGELFYNTDTKKYQKGYEKIGINRLIRAFSQLGIIPNDTNKFLDFSFVNYVSEAIMLLMENKNTLNEIFHLYNPNYISLDELGTLLSNEGIKLNKLQFSEFYDSVESLFLKEKTDAGIDKELIDILLFLHPSRILTLLQCKKTNEILNRLGFKWPEIIQENVHEIITIFKETKFM